MKRIISIILGFLLLATLALTALAEDGQGEGGFYIEELPSFGEDDELYFPEEETQMPAQTAEPTTTQPSQTTPPNETSTPEEAGGTPAPSSSEEQTTPAPTPAPEPQPNRAASELRDNLPVMIVVAVVALSALAAALVKKRKTTNRPPEAKRPNDIGGRK